MNNNRKGEYMAINNIFKLLNIIILSLTFLLFGGYNYANIKAQDEQLGTTDNPYIITSVTDFENYISLINNGATDANTGTQYKDAHYRLKADIVLNDMSVTYAEDKIQLAVNTATGVNQYYISGDLSELNQGIVIYDSQNNQPISIESVFNTNYFLQSNFGGSIDGNGHAIKGLMLLESYFINNLINGSLMNIDFQDVVMIRQGLTGSALIYNMQGASISNTQISGCVLSSSKNTAGFVSQMTLESSIQNCVNYATIIGNNIVGGFAGSADNNSLITNCINFGKIQGTGNYVAGIVANNSIEIHNCMNLGDISSSATTNYVGAIACNVGATDQITNCYTTTGKLIGKSTDTSGVVDLGWVSKLSNYSNTNFHSEYPWDFENVWTMQNGKPALKSFAKQSVVAPMEYFTEHYIENIADDNFSLHSTTSAIEYAGSKVDLEIIQIENYEFDASNTQNITSATLAENTTTTLKAYYKLPRFTVTFSAPDCTLESGSITQSIKYGNKITNFPVFTKPGYDITGWECSNGNNIDAPITESGIIFTPILQPVTYTITSNTNIGGNVTIQSSAIINQKIEFNVQPNAGYYVKSISILDGQNNAIHYTNNTFTMPSSNVRINVEFALNEYTITYNQSATYDIVLNRNGNILNSGSKVTTLDNITIIVTPKSGYKITDISFSTKNLTFANDVLSNILDDVNITISTELKSATYQVMHWLEDVDQNNTSTSNTRVKVNNIYYLLNSSESVNSQMNTMTQAEAKIFVGMSSLEFEQIYITEAITPLINIYYNRNEFSIIKFTYDEGNVQVVNKAKFGHTVNAVVTANLGYMITSINVKNLTTLETTTNTTFTMPASDIEITATFSAIPYTITYHNVQDVENNNPTIYNVESDDITLSNLTKQGYNFLGWATSADGEPQQNTTIQKGSTGNLDYYAIWELKNCAIIVQTSIGGNVNIQDSADYLDEVNFTISIDNGYTLQSLTIVDTQNNNITYSDNKFIMPESSVRIIANFTTINYNITYSNDDTYNITVTKGSGVLPSGGEFTVLDNLVVTVTPASGYKITNITLSTTKADFINNIISNAYDDITIFVTSEIKQTSYEVIHWVEDLEQSNTAISGDRILENGIYYNLHTTETIYTVMNTFTTATAKKLTGMSNLPFEQLKLTEVSEKIVKIYYNRNTYAIITPNYTGGNIQVAKNVKYGHTVNAVVTADLGYVVSSISVKNLTTLETTTNTTFTMPASDIEITATFGTIPYTITYHNVQDVENNNPTTYNVESDDITLSNLTKQGYNFLGWATSANGEPKLNATIQKGTTGNLDYYAIWDFATYSIVVRNSNGGSIDVVSSAKYLSEVTFSVTANNGYVLETLTIKDTESNNVNYLDNKFTMPASDIEITATFSAIPYTITYHNVQDVENNNPTTYNVESNDITLSNLTKQGYNFLGWATSADGEPKLNTIIQKGTTGDLDYYAIWDFATYSILVQSSNGGSIDVVSNAKYLSEVTFTVTANNGYVLETLTIKDTESNDINYSDNKFTMPTSDIEITATFGTIPYTITYHNVQDVENNNPTTYNVESNDITLSNLTKQGYNFLGWATSANGEPKLNTIIQKGSTGNLDYYAIWDFATYSIVVRNSNGGSIDVASSSKYLSEVTFTVTANKGYVLETLTIKDTESNNVNYSDNKFTMPASNVEITATFSTIPYSITYHNVKDVEHSNPTTYNVESNDITLINLTKQGYNFLGWATSANGEPKLNTIIQKGSTGDLDYYAIWDFATYSIVVHISNGGDVDVVTNAKYLSEVTFTVTTNNGYVLETLTIKDTKSNNVNYLDYKFTMPASDIEITATFSTIPYKITYHNVQDVENSNPTTYNVESDDITLSNLTKQGYNFLGWATSADGEPKLNAIIQKGTTGNLNYYAIWDIPQFCIHLETIYSNAEDILYSILDANVVLPTLESTGYTFVGWFYQTNVSNVIIYHGTDNVPATTLSDIRLDKNNSVQSIDVNANMLADYTLVAKWLPNTNTPYIIKHYLQVEGEQYKLHGSDDCFGTTDSTIIPNFLKIPGYIIQPFDNLTISPFGDTILEIYYNKRIYKITFHISNAELISGELYQELTYGESVTLPQVKKLGCEFSPVLWSVKSGNGSYDYVTDDLTIKAEFTPNIYTIKYLDNGQDITSSNSAIRHVYGTTTQIWQPEKEGNTFLYWRLNDTDTIITDALDNTFYSANNIITLNAVWEIITYTITYNGNYDSLDVSDVDDVNIPAPQTKYYDTDITIRNITGRYYGYEFVEWNTSPEGNGLSYNAYSTYADNAELTLYAIWRYVEVAITFDVAMPFQPNIQPITRSYNQVIGELPSVQEVPGYEFLGWYLADRVINAEYIIRFETDQTLTAKWQKLVYTMTIDLNGGTSSTLSQPILIAGSIGDTYKLPNDITRIGWSLIDVQFDNTSYTYENSVITFGYNDTTATLIWSEIIYNINYNSNSVYAQGNMTSTQFAYGEDITLAKNTYTRPGYEFGGWSTLPYGRVPEFYDETTMCMDIENDVTLYAVWYELLDSIEQIVDDDMINKITLVCTNGVNEAIRMSFTRLSKNETEQYNIEGVNGAYIVNLDYNQAPYTLNKDCQLKLRLIEDQTFLYKDIYLINDKSKQKLTYTISDGYIIIDLHKLSDGDVLIIADNIGGVVESIIWLLLTVVLIGCALLGLYFLRKYKLLTKSNKKEIVEINKTIEVKNKKDM